MKPGSYRHGGGGGAVLQNYKQLWVSECVAVSTEVPVGGKNEFSQG